MPKIYLISIFLMILGCTSKMEKVVEDEHLVENLMRTRPGQFQDIIDNKDKYEVQVIYTQINRDSNNVPSFRSFYYNFDSARYFYPASTVKMPVAFLALEKLNELNIEGLNKNTVMLTDSAFSGQTTAHVDSTSASGFPSIAHYIKKVFLVSDNDAFNRLYEFVGQGEINEKLKAKGYDNSRIIHRLSITLNEEENRHTNPIRFMRGDSVIYRQPPVRNDNPLPLKGTVMKGKGYQKGDEIVREPMDFTHKNFIPLNEMQQMLKAVMFPEFTDGKQTFHLTQDDCKFLYRYMSQFPLEMTYPDYDTSYFDAFVKFLMFGNDKSSIPKHIRVFNKIGQAYGFFTDNAYIIDTRNKVEFMLSAVILTNENEIFNDGVYEYEEEASPFMKNLGQLIYEYELQRKREHIPDLSKFMISYDKIIKVSDRLHPNLYQNYEHYHIPELDHQKITRDDIAPLIEKLREIPGFEVSKVGESVEGREINLIRLGNGPRKVLLWSQMHGDESTATRALFEIFRFFTSQDVLDPMKQNILDQTTLYFIPMLNPDGAEVFKRQNALDIDLNRDALRLVSPESKILKKIRDQYDPEFGFNLHDQSRYYNVGYTGKTAAISFLAPAYNYDKDINEDREKAIKLIASMNEVLQQYIPGQVGRYNDDFEPRAFGDNIQKWGTSTVLIESGGYPGDPEKQHLVKMNFVAILHALEQIANGSYQNESMDKYNEIPENDRNFYDLLIRNGEVMKNGKPYLMDIGIFVNEEAGAKKSVIEDLGDLSTFYGYKEVDAKGLTISTGKIYPEVLKSSSEINEKQALEWLKKGYIAVRVERNASDGPASELPICFLTSEDTALSDVSLGNKANLIISNEKEVLYAVVNGEVIKLKD